ncbi:MAG: squalene cyclase, partial [Spirochaetes bacterium]|nr:squalene cyclase [Spirochaetota bacterium]
MSENQIEWLMGGDPAIRWPVLNDLLDSSRSDVDAERRLVSETGWGRKLIAAQGADGRWAAESGP